MRVLDSDHCVAILRGSLDLRSWASADEHLAVTSVTVGELVHGAHRSARTQQNLARIEVLLASVVTLAYDDWCARQYGRVKAELEHQGLPLADLDLQIAAICLQQDAILVTHNRCHFERVSGLRLEDWLSTA